MNEATTDLTQCLVCDWHIENDKLRERIEELEEKLEDWENSAKFVLGDDCPTDEVHCGCVVILKKRIKELEAENKQLLELSENLNEHPEGYNGPCLCQLCKSYG